MCARALDTIAICIFKFSFFFLVSLASVAQLLADLRKERMW